MGESTKAVCSLIMIVGLIAATLAWLADQPDTTVWGVRIGAPVLALMALGLMLKLHWRQDLEHDYLAERVGSYFNRDGFCFGFVVTPIHGIAYVDAYFQTQYDTPSIGRIALRPTRGFFLTRANIETMTFEVECPPCGFGLIRLAIPIPEKLQGKKHSFEVGASIKYPEGKGRRVRFQDGVFLRTDSNFGDSFGTTLTLLGAASGTLVISNPATVNLLLPVDVAECLTGKTPPVATVLWRQGDPPLKSDLHQPGSSFH